MGLKNIIRKLGGAAPLLSGALNLIPGGPAIGMLARTFGLLPDASPEEVDKAMGADPNMMAKVRLCEAENEGELKIAVAAIDKAEVEAYYNLQNIQAQSDDVFVRRQRPTFGYIISFCFGFQFLATFGSVLVALTFDTALNYKTVLDGLVSLNQATMPIWGIALTVQGYNIGKRSQDKEVAAGNPPSGIIPSILRKFK